MRWISTSSSNGEQYWAGCTLRFSDGQVSPQPHGRPGAISSPGAEEYLPAATPALRQEWDELGATLSTLPITGDNYGLIYGDFELDNLVWQDHSIAILDFDNCAYSWYAVDLAIALQDLFEDGFDADMPALRAFVQGYRQHHPLTADMLFRIPLFLRLENLLGYTRLARTLDLPPDAQQPAWLNGLRSKLQHYMDQYTASLVTNEA